MLDSLTLDQLRILVTVSETGSFTAAGRKLHRVQSAISQSIQSLEVNQQLQLFDRSGKTPVLTDAGRVLVAQARHVLRQADSFTNMAASIAAGLEPEFNLAVENFFPNALIMASLRALQEQFPFLPVALFTEGMGSARRLKNGTAELAIFAFIPSANPELKAYPLVAIRLVPVVASGHPLAATHGRVTRDVLQEHIQLVLTDPSDSSGPSYGIVSSRTWRFVDLNMRLDFLLAGFGWANMPLPMVADHLKTGSLVELDMDEPGVSIDEIPLFAVHDRSRPLGKAAQWLLDDLRQRATEYAEKQP
jgi:DNA-binding transcriptional LysR family regulator